MNLIVYSNILPQDSRRKPCNRRENCVMLL